MKLKLPFPQFCSAIGLPAPVAEHRFHEVRRWRFDFAWPEHKVALEIDKTTALGDGGVFDLLHTADSMAWSFAARKQGRNANDYREAQAFRARIERQERQGALAFA